MLHQKTRTYSLPLVSLKSVLVALINDPDSVTPDIQLVSIVEDTTIKGIFTRTVRSLPNGMLIKERVTVIDSGSTYSTLLTMLDNFPYRGNIKYTLTTRSENTTDLTISINWQNDFSTEVLDNVSDMHFNVFNRYFGLDS